jgi:glycerophosphoryl diester phosphodiesterase
MPGDQNIKPSLDLKRPLIFAHRGSSAYAPENTLAAFNLAVQQHADVIELDVKLTADDQVVVIHDDSVDRTTNGIGQISSLSLPELKRLDAGSKYSPVFQAEKIPTLAEVFEAVEGKIIINIELKNYASPLDDLPNKVISLIKAYKLESSVFLSSFNFIALIRAHYLLPTLPLGLLTIAGLANPTLRSRLVRFGPQLALCPNYVDVSTQLIRAAHRANCQIYTYTVNQPDSMKQLFSIGVDGIITDDPPLAQKVLAETIP